MLQEAAMIPHIQTIGDNNDEAAEEARPTLGHGLIASRLQQALGPFVEQHELGHVFSAQTFFRIGTDTRDTDLAYVAKERLANLPPDLDVDADFAPNLAVEIASRGDALAAISHKVSAYLDAGVQAVWVVNPWLRTIEVYRQGGQITVLTRAQTLTGDPVVPGFSVPLSDIFPA